MDKEIASARRATDKQFKKLIKDDKKRDARCERAEKMARDKKHKGKK